MENGRPRKKARLENGIHKRAKPGWRTDYTSPQHLTLQHHQRYHGNFPGDGNWLDLPIVPRWRPSDYHLHVNNPGDYPSESDLKPLPPAILEAEMDRCHYCQLKEFEKYILAPVTITNDLDESYIDPNFMFIQRCIASEGVDYVSDEFRSGCECASGADCAIGCSDQADSQGVGHGIAYDRFGYLRDEILLNGTPIYECHDDCACDRWCPNKVINRGRTIPLDIFRTEGRGWGVRSSVPIKRGQYIDKYVGEIVTSQTANARRAESHIAQRKDVYLFALDKFHDAKSLDSRLAADPYEIDGENASGPTRFINHSCAPNLRIIACVTDYAEKYLHDLAFFALEDIEPGQELTFDYVDADEGEDQIDPELLKDMTKCLCGADECRGYLW